MLLSARCAIISKYANLSHKKRVPKRPVGERVFCPIIRVQSCPFSCRYSGVVWVGRLIDEDKGLHELWCHELLATRQEIAVSYDIVVLLFAGVQEKWH